MSKVRRLKNEEVDRQKWDDCIAGSLNTLPYAYSWYLDAVAENWDALVLNNYEAVMPLVWLRKFSVKCMYQPYYCQQLGVFAKSAISKAALSDFLATATEQFAYIDCNLNALHKTTAGDFKLTQRKNLLLNLNPGYTELKKAFSENHRRNIAKAEKAGLAFFESTDLVAFRKLYLNNLPGGKMSFKPKHEKIFKQLTGTLIERGIAKIFAVADAAGQWQSALVLIQHQNRYINIINASSAAGKKTGAAHFLFNGLIKAFAGQAIILDFEGSSIATIARFYEGFGAKEEWFYHFQTSLIKRARQRFS